MPTEMQWRLESELYSTYFWYDKLGRIVLSQNTKQFASTSSANNRYSYTLYDALGRVYEAGEKTENSYSDIQFAAIFGDTIANYFNPDVINDDSLLTWIGESSGSRKEVTRSYYDSTSIDYLPDGFTRTHLRKRIAHVTYEETYDGYDSTYQYATHYSYDIHACPPKRRVGGGM